MGIRVAATQYTFGMRCGVIFFWGGELKWKFASQRVGRQLRTSKQFIEVKGYSPKDLDYLSKDDTKNFIRNNPKGYGYWIWKPILILDFLERYPLVDGILYMDSGCEFISNPESDDTWRKYVEKLVEFDAVFFENDLKEYCWTKQELFDHLKVSKSEQSTNQLVGGTFLMSREFALVFCQKWLGVMEADNFLYVNDVVDSLKQRVEFREHRYDQSVLSIMAKREKNICVLSGHHEIYFPGNWRNKLHKPIWTARNGSFFSILNQSLLARYSRRLERVLNYLWKKFDERSRVSSTSSVNNRQ